MCDEPPGAVTAVLIQKSLHPLCKQQQQRQPVRKRQPSVLHQPDGKAARAVQCPVKRRVEIIQTVQRAVILAALKAYRRAPVQQQTCCGRAGDGERLLLRQPVNFRKTRVAAAGAAERVLAQRTLNIAQTVRRQQRTGPVLHGKARLAILFHTACAHALAKRARQRAVARERVGIENDLPVLAAGVGARARETLKFRVIIGIDQVHMLRLFSRASYTMQRRSSMIAICAGMWYSVKNQWIWRTI